MKTSLFTENMKSTYCMGYFYIFLFIFIKNTECLQGQCPGDRDLAPCGAPEIVDAGVTGVINITPFPFRQNFDMGCRVNMSLPYRSADGHCNHVRNFGSAETPLRRLLPPKYQDGVSSPRTRGASGRDLPSPTDVSRLLHTDQDNFDGFSLLFMQWGQFIDHDMALTPVPTETGAAIHCCGANGSDPDSVLDEACMPIKMANADGRFEGSCMEFVRSVAAKRADGTILSPREQLNAVTSFIDGSMIYGSHEEMMTMLREPAIGGMNYLMHMENNLLPRSGMENCVHKPEHYCFLAGDSRVNEHPGLTAMHTVWVRLHNVIAAGLRAARAQTNSEADSAETLFQMTRKIVVALVQQITYREWLPRVIGLNMMSTHNLWPWKKVAYSPMTDPSITNAFATAAFRFGHSMIPRHFKINGTLHPLRSLFHRTDMIHENFDGVLRSLLSPTSDMQAPAVDRRVVDEVTGHLFEPEDQEPSRPSRGLDLVALNIQRGRDHGLPGYNAFRQVCGLSRVHSFEEASRLFGATIGEELSRTYSMVDDIDLFTGGLLEPHLDSASVGETFACIIALQFNALKFGDKFFYETDRMPEGFSDPQIIAIRRLSLAHVLCQMNVMTSVQRFAFVAPSPENPSMDCGVMNQHFLDYSLWATDEPPMF